MLTCIIGRGHFDKIIVGPTYIGVVDRWCKLKHNNII